MNPFNEFEKIYCINLDSRVDRWSLVVEEFKKVGILDYVNRMPGVVYTGTNDRHINACLGNHLAHAKCLEDAKRHGLDSCLIFEDDVEFFEDAYENLTQAIAELPTDWDMFYLGVNMDVYYAYQVSDHIAKLTGGFATHAYAVKSRLFDKLIEVNLDLSISHNDVVYANQIIPNHDCYIPIPLVAGQRLSYSDIEGRVTEYNGMFKQRFSERLIKNVGDQA